MLLLSDLVGSDVRAAEGTVIGHLVDVTVEVGPDHPTVQRLGIGRHRRIRAFVDWGAVTSFEHDDIQLSVPVASISHSDRNLDLTAKEVLLVRDVLDTQIIDVSGKRLARVSEVLLARTDGRRCGSSRSEVGAAGVWRRLGLDRDRRTNPGSRPSIGRTCTSPPLVAMPCNSRPRSAAVHRLDRPRARRRGRPPAHRQCGRGARRRVRYGRRRSAIAARPIHESPPGSSMPSRRPRRR